MLHSVALHSGIKLNGGTLGIATIGMMCLGRYSSGLAQDTGSSVAFLASIAAHELGHILNMNHDDGRKYSCVLAICPGYCTSIVILEVHS